MSNSGKQEVLLEEIARLKEEIQKLQSRPHENFERHEIVFEMVNQHLNAAFWLSNVQKNSIQYISPGYEKVWGRSCASLYQSPRSWMEAIHPEDRSKVQEAATTRQTDGDYEEEYRIIKPDGSIRWIRDRAFPIKNKEGKIFRIVGLAEDITDQKLYQLALLESESKLTQILQNVKLVFWLHNLETQRIIYISPGYEKVWGRSCNEIYLNPRAWFDSVHPDDQPRVFQMTFVSRPSDDFEYEYRIIRPDGAIRWIRSRVTSIRNAAGEIHRLTGTAEDITERRTINETLRESEEKYRNLFECGTDGIFIFDAETLQINEVNDTGIRMLGYSKPEFLNLKIVDICLEPQKTIENLKRIRDGGSPSKISQCQLQKKNLETFPAEISVGKFYSGNRLKFLAFIRDITERKKNQDALSISEIRYRSLVEATSNTVFHIDSNGIGSQESVQWWSNLTGQTPEESLGFGWVNAIHPDDRDRAVKQWTHSFKNQSKFEIEYRIQTPKKDYRHYSVRLVPIQNPFQNHVEWVGSILDITEKKIAEEEHKRRQIELQILFDLIPAYIWYKDKENNIVNLNKRAADSMGKSVEDLKGRSVFKIYPNEAVKYFKDDLEVIKSGSSKLGIIEQLTDKNGKKTWIQTDKVPFKMETGETLGVVVLSQDITERKKAEDSVQESEARLRALLNASPDVMLRINNEGLILDRKFPQNSSGWEFSRKNKASKIQELFPSEIVSQFFRHARHALESGLTQMFECQIPSKSQILDFEVRIVAYNFNEVIIILRNMTEYRQLERRILDANEYQKRQIGQDLHDGLGQHLTGIAFLGKVLSEKLRKNSAPETKEAQKIVQYVNEAISQTRTLARGLHPIELETNGLQSALKEIAIQTEKVFHVRCHLHYEDHTLFEDQSVASHLYRIIQEAIHNAIRHGKAKNIHIRFKTKDGKIILEIYDDGFGLSKTRKQGKGMGLEIMKYRARAIGATLELKPGHPRGVIVQTLLTPSTMIQNGKSNGNKIHVNPKRKKKSLPR